MLLTCVGSAALVKTNRVWQTFSRCEAAPDVLCLRAGTSSSSLLTRLAGTTRYPEKTGHDF